MKHPSAAVVGYPWTDRTAPILMMQLPGGWMIWRPTGPGSFDGHETCQARFRKEMRICGPLSKRTGDLFVRLLCL